MAKSATGKLVSKVGAAGGGKAYKKSRPINYYGSLVVIVVLGIVSIVYARYDYQHPTAASQSASGQPTIGTTWFSVASFDICGVNQALLQPYGVGSAGFAVGTNDVIRIKPVSSADAGSHATVAQFANEYPGFIASSTNLTVPVKTGTKHTTVSYHNGLLCPASSKYAKQAGQIEYAYWRNFGQTTPTIVTDPSKIKFSNLMELTIAFLPKGVAPLRPASAGVNAMVSDNATAATTTTTVAATSTSSTTSSTTTTVKG